jgi:hypothetical protein
MRPRRAAAVIEIGAQAVFVVMIVRMLALMHMAMHVFATVGVLVAMLMRPGDCCPMIMLMLIAMPMRVAMHRAILVNMRMFMRIFVQFTFNPRLTRATTANCTHSPCLLFLTTRFQFP